MKFEQDGQNIQIFQEDRLLKGDVLYSDAHGLQLLTREYVEGPVTVALPYTYVEAVANWQQQLSADGTRLVVIRYRAVA